jgi:hypothetical protein
MTNKSTHIKKEELIVAQSMVNTVQILLKKTEYNLNLGDQHRQTIQWELAEAELYEQAKRILRDKEARSS